MENRLEMFLDKELVDHAEKTGQKGGFISGEIRTYIDIMFERFAKKGICPSKFTIEIATEAVEKKGCLGYPVLITAIGKDNREQ